MEQKLDQKRAPIYEALETFRHMRVVPFDVPGHKHGKGNPELVDFLGEKCVGIDVNSMKPLDNLCHPVSVIREAEILAADAFGAAHAFLMVGGNDQFGAKYGVILLQAGRQDYFASQCTSQRDQCAGALRRHSGICQSGSGSQAGDFSWHASGAGAKSH